MPGPPGPVLRSSRRVVVPVPPPPPPPGVADATGRGGMKPLLLATGRGRGDLGGRSNARGGLGCPGGLAGLGGLARLRRLRDRGLRGRAATTGRSRRRALLVGALPLLPLPACADPRDLVVAEQIRGGAN